MTYKGYASNHLFSYASLSQQTEFVTHLYQEQNPQVYTDTRSLHVGLKTPQTPGNLPLDVTGRTTLSQSNPVVNSKARFQPARGVFFRKATISCTQPRRSATQFNFRLNSCVAFTSGYIVALSWAMAYCFTSSFAGPCILNSVHCQHWDHVQQGGPLALLCRPPFVASWMLDSALWAHSYVVLWKFDTSSQLHILWSQYTLRPSASGLPPHVFAT